MDNIHVDENGDVEVDDDYVIGLADDIFGDKIYETVVEQVTQAIDKVAVDNQPKDKALEALQEALKRRQSNLSLFLPPPITARKSRLQMPST